MLYTEWPLSARRFREGGSVDRELDIAISQFAPGSQTVKDKAVHTACGVVDFLPQGNDVAVRPGFNPPLTDPSTKIGLCGNCRALIPQDMPSDIIHTNVPPQVLECPLCHEPELRIVDAREPRNFFTDQSPQDYEGQFEWQPQRRIRH